MSPLAVVNKVHKAVICAYKSATNTKKELRKPEQQFSNFAVQYSHLGSFKKS